MPLTTRGSIPYPQDSDEPDVPADLELAVDRIAEIMAIDDQGPIGSRPAAGEAGRFYTDTATGITYRDDGTQWRALNAPAGSDVPTGAIILVAQNAVPAGFFELNAQAVSRTTYAALFALYGTTYGAGDGSTTFNLPDWRGRKVVHVGSDGTLSSVGQTDGLSLSNRRATHTHAHTMTLPAHKHNDDISVFVPSVGCTFSLSTLAHSHGGGTGIENNSIGVQVASNPANVAARYPHAHGIGAEAVPVTGSISTGATAASKSGGVQNPSTSPAIDGSIALATEPYAVAKFCVKY